MRRYNPVRLFGKTFWQDGKDNWMRIYGNHGFMWLVRAWGIQPR